VLPWRVVSLASWIGEGTNETAFSLPDPPMGQNRGKRSDVTGTTKTGLRSALGQIADGSVT